MFAFLGFGIGNFIKLSNFECGWLSDMVCEHWASWKQSTKCNNRHKTTLRKRFNIYWLHIKCLAHCICSDNSFPINHPKVSVTDLQAVYYILYNSFFFFCLPYPWDNPSHLIPCTTLPLKSPSVGAERFYFITASPGKAIRTAGSSGNQDSLWVKNLCIYMRVTHIF